MRVQSEEYLPQSMNWSDLPEMLQSPMVPHQLTMHPRLMARLDLSTPLSRLILRPTSNGESDMLLVLSMEDKYQQRPSH